MSIPRRLEGKVAVITASSTGFVITSWGVHSPEFLFTGVLA